MIFHDPWSKDVESGVSRSDGVIPLVVANAQRGLIIKLPLNPQLNDVDISPSEAWPILASELGCEKVGTWVSYRLDVL